MRTQNELTTRFSRAFHTHRHIGWITATLALTLLVMATGCNTGNPFMRMQPNYAALPVEELRAMANQIEQAVAQGDRDAVFPDQGAVTVDTTQLRQAIRTRAARAELLHELLAAGYLKEEKSGLVGIERNRAYTQATTRRERDRHAMVVMGENRDRWTLYEGIVKENNYASRNLSAIQAIFHEARLAHLPSNAIYDALDPAMLP